MSNPKTHRSVSINQGELTLEKVIAVTRHFAPVSSFEGEQRNKVDEVRRYVEEKWLGDDSEPQYGFNTGIGILKSVRIPEDQIKEFQRRYIKSHCVGVGDPFPVEIVRGAILLLAHSISKGYSGIRAVIIDKLIEMLNKGIHPVVPEQGSLGASGDLAPLSHLASVLVGEDEAEIWIGGHRHQVAKLKDESGTIFFEHEGKTASFAPLTLHGKEAISLTNSTAMMLSVALHLIFDTAILLKNADIAVSLSLEAMMCEKNALAEELHAARNQQGQIVTAQNIGGIIKGSKRMTPQAQSAYFDKITERDLAKKLVGTELQHHEEAILKYKHDFEFEKNRVQDAYSLRCAPQVHGACKDAFKFVKGIVEHELQAVTDNPLIFKTADGYEVKSGGNFHGEPLALAMDFLAIALSEIGSISERRMFRLLSPRMSFGLPSNLSGGRIGLNSGYMMVQYTGAQLVSENKTLAHPASVDSVPTSDNQEDHVSMGMIAARKSRQILKNVQNLVGMELMCAVQGIHLSAAVVGLDEFPLGQGSETAFEFISNNENPFPLMKEDVYLHSRIEAIFALSNSAKVIEHVEERTKLHL